MQRVIIRAEMSRRSRSLLSGGFATKVTALVSLFAVASCKQEDGSGLLSVLTQTPVPADYANKAWKVDIGSCSYVMSFDDNSVRTDVAKCGDKVAFNSFKTVAKPIGSGVLLSSVALARNSCKKLAKQAVEMNPFFVEIGADGGLEVWTRKKVNSVKFAPTDPGEILVWIQSAPTDGTACVN